MKYAPLLLLLAAGPAQAASPWWLCPEDRAEVNRVARLTALECGPLYGVVEQERAGFNQQTMMQYNRMLPIPLPMMPTPEVAAPPRTFRLR